MKFVKTAAVVAAALLALHTLPELVSGSLTNAQDTDEEIVDALVVAYEEDTEDPGNYRAITSDDSLSNLSPNASSLVHNSRYDDYIKLNGIDVSKFQGSINWDSVAADGVDFAIIRVGYRGYDGGLLVTDPKYYDNMDGATAAGLDVGVYFFSQAISVQEAIDEANLVLARVQGYPITCPIYIDVENTSPAGRLDKANLSIAQRTAIVEAFCQTIEDAGYQAGVYANKYYFLNYLDPDYLSTKYDIWLAHYITQTSYTGDYQAWQYTDKGSVNGISGAVDCDVMYSQKVSFLNDEITIDDTAVSVKPDCTGDGVLSFASSDPSIATVDETGNITGISDGSVQITVSSSNGSSDTLTVHVELTDYGILKYSGLLLNAVGETQVISKAGTTLVSSDANVAAVSENGTVQAVGCGVAEITADDGNGNTAVCQILVTDSDPIVGDCNLDGTVNAIDSVYVLWLSSALGATLSTTDFSDGYLALYDFNGDGKVDATDASDILISSAYAGAGYVK